MKQMCPERPRSLVREAGEPRDKKGIHECTCLHSWLLSRPSASSETPSALSWESEGVLASE